MRVSNDKRRKVISKQSIIRYWIDVFFILNVSTFFGVLLSKNDTSINKSHIHNV